MKCKFWKKCPWYNEESITCKKNAGMYYDMDRPAGCYRRMEEKEEKDKK